MEKNIMFESENKFTAKMRNCEWAYIAYTENPTNESWEAFGECLCTLSEAITSCVLRKIYEKSGDAMIYKLLCQSFSDDSGFLSDLKNSCVLFVLDNLHHVDCSKIGFFEQKITVRKLDKRVVIQRESSAGFKDVESTLIQECFKHVRQSVRSAKTAVSPAKFLYLDEVITDEKTGDTYTVYERLPLYCSLTAEVTDVNGAVLYQRTDEYLYRKAKYLKMKLKLSDMERKYLSLRIKGYGDKAIATYTGFTLNSVKGIRNRIRKKANDIMDEFDNL